MSQTSPKILVNSCNFYNQLKSGLNFASVTDPTNNLAGSVGERIRLELEVGVAWFFIPDSSNSLIISNVGLMAKRQSGSWIDDGFSAGDTIIIVVNNVGGNMTIATINDLNITMTYNSGTLPAIGTYTDSELNCVYGVTSLTALIYKFGLIGNSETYNILSKISNNEQAYYVAGIVHVVSPPSYHNMQKVGNYEDWITGNNSTTSNESIVNYVNVNTVGYVTYQRFKITHQFIINPFYLEDWISHFENNTIPSLLSGLQSLKYVFECEFRTVLSNPNTSKTARVENNLGSVGWFNENYNGFNNNYHIHSIVYTDTGTGATCNGLQRGARTTAIITVHTNSPTIFNLTDPNGVVLFSCIEQPSYQNQLTNVEENFLFDDAINTEGNATPSQGTNNIIKNFSSVRTSTTELVLTVEVEYSAAQQVLIPINTKYFIGCQVANDNLTSGNSDKVILTAGYSTYVASPDISNLMYVTGFETYQHFVTDPTIVTGTTKADLWNEDGLCFKFDFWLDLNLNTLLNSLKFLVIAYDSTTGNYFILDQYSINLNNVIISGGVQQINITDSRGYQLNTSDYFGKVIVTTGTNILGKQYYKMYIGQKVPWQSWKNNIGVDTVFYDSSKPNNNLNYKTSNYSNLNNYDIKFALLANVYGTNVLGVSGNTDYFVISPDMITYDYDLPTTWVAVITTWNVAGTVNLGGVIRNDADTLFRITWVRTGAFNVGYNFWAIHRIEESQESGTNIYEFSSIISSITNNLLKPVSGQTLLKMTVDPFTNTIVTECLIDFLQLDPSKNYKISGRLDDGNAVPYIPVGKLTEEGTLKIDENGNVKIIE